MRKENMLVNALVRIAFIITFVYGISLFLVACTPKQLTLGQCIDEVRELQNAVQLADKDFGAFLVCKTVNNDIKKANALLDNLAQMRKNDSK